MRKGSNENCPNSKPESKDLPPSDIMGAVLDTFQDDPLGFNTTSNIFPDRDIDDYIEQYLTKERKAEVAAVRNRATVIADQARAVGKELDLLRARYSKAKANNDTATMASLATEMALKGSELK